MSATGVKLMATEASASTYDRVKEGALGAVNWMGKQIQWLGSTIKDYAIAVYNWAKPFFQGILNLVYNAYDKLRDLVVTNKEAAVAVAIAGPLFLIGGVAAYMLCCKEKVETTVKTTDGTATTTTTSSAPAVNTATTTAKT